jgi:hypothetical protein
MHYFARGDWWQEIQSLCSCQTRSYGILERDAKVLRVYHLYRIFIQVRWSFDGHSRWQVIMFWASFQRTLHILSRNVRERSLRTRERSERRFNYWQLTNCLLVPTWQRSANHFLVRRKGWHIVIRLYSFLIGLEYSWWCKTYIEATKWGMLRQRYKYQLWTSNYWPISKRNYYG